MKPGGAWLAVVATVSCLSLQAEEEPAAADAAVHKQALGRLQSYVAQWRGVGQLQRGSTKGAWQEDAAWAWNFEPDRVSMAFTSPDGKYFVRGEVTPGETEGTFRLELTPAEDEPADIYAGTLDDEDRLVFLAEEDAAANRPARLTMRQVADGDRLVVLLEKKVAGSERFVRLAEIGYTRQGSAFGKGSTGPECVVTGGLGTIQVEHDGKEYSVCCTGCKDLFDSDPEGVLADYRQRLAEKK